LFYWLQIKEYIRNCFNRSSVLIEILVLMGSCSTASRLVEAWGSSKSIQKLVSFTHSVDSQRDKNMTYV